jgi:2-keto-4-pentenoate hydratase
MQIIKAHDQNGWITAIIQNRWVQAKVYNDPSTYGINNGRVSKLAIGKTNVKEDFSNFFDQMCYNYDRGLDFDESPSGLLEKIVEELESLPQIVF